MLRRLLLIVPLLCAACVVRIPGWGDGSTQMTLFGVEVEERDGVLYADGVELPYERWVTVTGELPADTAITLATVSGDIDVRGVPGRAYALEVLLHSEVEGDGAVVFEDGRLVARSATGHALLLNEIHGTLPADAPFDVSTGTGEIELLGWRVAGAGRIESGTGAIALTDCRVASLDLANGTASIDLLDVEGERLGVATGTGDVVLRGCRFATSQVESGTGDLSVHDSTLDVLRIETGTGDVCLAASAVDEVHLDSGTGDLVLEGDEACRARLFTSMGTGDVIRR